ncbi:MAG: GldG family protein [Kiritimatiellae bacterium]|nr:GldG family protein [Kiritimatiellia bacterium]
MKLRAKRALMKGNALVVIGLAVILAVMINYLAVQHRVRIDISPSRYYALSAATLNILRNLTVPAQAIVFMSVNHEEFNEVKQLLKEYECASRKFGVEYVDPHRDLARAKELAGQYNVAGPGVIVFRAGNRTKTVAVNELATYDYAPLLAGHPKVMTSFRGEPVFSSALFSLMQDRSPVVYFLAGHGEQRIDDFSQHAGYSMIARLLEKGNIQPRTFHISEGPSIPKDCDVLVIGGQKKPLTHVEAEMVKKYLDDSGRLLLMADSGVETGLEKVLETWGIRLGMDRVAGTTLTGRELLISHYGNHPITEQLQNMATIFNVPRSVQPLAPDAQSLDQSADKPRVMILAATSDEGWAEMTFYQNPPKFDAGVDRRGPIPVAVAVEKGSLTVDVEIKPTRLAVIGDSTFVSNGALLAGYSPDFFIHALNWLLERRDAPVFSPKTPPRVRLNIDQKRLRVIYIVAIVALPAMILAIGLAVYLGRRK